MRWAWGFFLKRRSKRNDCGMALEEAKGISIRRLVLEGSPFAEIARTVRIEKVGLVGDGSYGGAGGCGQNFFRQHG